MKLLFDENLSPSLVRSLNALYPGSTHVAHEMLDSASDATIWDFFLGSPPQVIWLKVGNCSASAIETLIEVDTETCLILSLKNDRSASR